MSIAKLQQDLMSAMKAKDAVRVGTLRLLLSSVKNKQIELGHELSQEEVLQVVKKEVKQRKDSIAQYQAVNRTDLVEEESAELAVLEDYMPAQMDEAAIVQEVDKVIADTGAAGPADMDKVMGALSGLRDQADMGMVSKVVRERLASQG